MTSTDTLPKSAWGPGPWQDEPDEARWTDEATGLRCAIIRSEVSGALCGYVEIDHPSLCRSLEELEKLDFDVHGGLTWSGLRFEDETGWWIGFDCGHAWDVMPAIDALLRKHGHQKPSRLEQLVDALDGGFFRSTYKDIAFVRTQCAYLALQVRRASQLARGLR